jgi:hypothetical protein
MDSAGTEYAQGRCSQKMDDAGTAISKMNREQPSLIYPYKDCVHEFYDGYRPQ